MTDVLRDDLTVSHMKSDFVVDAKSVEMHEFSVLPLAQNGASESARQSASSLTAERGRVGPDLGEPLSMQEVAALLGCSAWTVRQKYLTQGLPHLRACPGGRLVFFRQQVVAWILKRQQLQKGGLKK